MASQPPPDQGPMETPIDEPSRSRAEPDPAPLVEPVIPPPD